MTITIEPLAHHKDLLPLLEQWFITAWPNWYGPAGPGDARHDLNNFARRGTLPTGLLAFMDGNVCGVAALKADSIESHAHLTPWAAAGLVAPHLRGQGIGARLLGALEDKARRLGHTHIHCATATAESLLLRCGGEVLERIHHDGQRLGVFRKAL